MDEKKTLKQRIEWAVIVWLARRLPDCRSMTETMGRSVDGRTTLRERLVQRLHLFTCQGCRRYLEQIEFLRRAFRYAEDRFASAGPGLSEEAKDRIRKALRTLA